MQMPSNIQAIANDEVKIPQISCVERRQLSFAVF
jgi:hypothetical protein